MKMEMSKVRKKGRESCGVREEGTEEREVRRNSSERTGVKGKRGLKFEEWKIREKKMGSGR